MMRQFREVHGYESPNWEKRIGEALAMSNISRMERGFLMLEKPCIVCDIELTWSLSEIPVVDHVLNDKIVKELLVAIVL